MIKFFLITVILYFSLVGSALCANSGIVDTKHNLSASGPGTIHAISETRICIFCHTPHNATPSSPLWNRDLSGANYDTYESSTIDVTVTQPTGTSRLCLSCHDGTIALGAVNSEAGGVQMSMELSGRPSRLGTDLRDDHPFSFSYDEAQLNEPQLQPNLPDEMLNNGNYVQCTTCHDPHDDKFGMFLLVDNKFSGLCLKCHNIAGWSMSSHANSGRTWGGAGNNPWPLNDRLSVSNVRTTVAENGCENCHTPHNAGGAKRLLNYLEEEKNCIYACHNSQGPGKDIAQIMLNVSAHPVQMATIGDPTGTPHDSAEDVGYLTGHVECQDCHNPHSILNSPASAPNISGMLMNVKGIDQFGSVVNPANYEYELCFKCHGESNGDSVTINRYANSLNKRLDFSTNNPSFHPVVGMGRNSDVPSLPSQISPDPSINEQTIIYCMDCHDSDASARIGGPGPVGPHGSVYSPLLRERYETSLNTVENYSDYALCYRCHERASILSDESFKKATLSFTGGHSGHLASGGGTPCSVCHDPHGVVDDGISGDHTNLINFDANVVNPISGQSVPLFNDTGLFSGSCTLVCHGVVHTAYAYP